MTIYHVAYYDTATGDVNSVRSGPDLDGFQSPESGESTVQLPGPVDLPGYISGGTFFQKPLRPGAQWTWNSTSKAWVPDIPAVRLYAKEIVDNKAGDVRRRYITSVPGQAETYMKKEEQARAWAAAGHAGTAPSFIAAEATALGVTAVSVCDDIIANADYWQDVKGPEIEACRRKWAVIIDNEEPDANVIMFRASQGSDELDTL